MHHAHDIRPLSGFTVGVTAARRAEEQIALLRRQGAEVRHAPALRTVPLADDGALRTATRQLIDSPPDIVLATTAVGFRGWLAVAREWDIDDALLGVLGEAELLTRGPKVRGAVRAAGLAEDWSPSSESMAEVRERLLARGVVGQRIALQLHGEPLPGLIESLRTAGAEVITVPVYRWVPPADLERLDRLVRSVIVGDLDAVTFTSAPAAASLLARAEHLGQQEELLAALRHRVLPVCVGPVAAQPLQSRDVPVPWPDRFRLVPLVRLLCQELPSRISLLSVAGRKLQIRGHAVLLDGQLRPVPPASMALLRILAQRPGRVVSRTELLGALPGTGRHEHAVDSALARLRAALGEPGLVQPVAKHGYRLAVEPEAAGGTYHG